jgi:hypothetical protein
MNYNKFTKKQLWEALESACTFLEELGYECDESGEWSAGYTLTSSYTHWDTASSDWDMAMNHIRIACHSRTGGRSIYFAEVTCPECLQIGNRTR